MHCTSAIYTLATPDTVSTPGMMHQCAVPSPRMERSKDRHRHHPHRNFWSSQCTGTDGHRKATQGAAPVALRRYSTAIACLAVADLATACVPLTPHDVYEAKACRKKVGKFRHFLERRCGMGHGDAGKAEAGPSTSSHISSAHSHCRSDTRRGAGLGRCLEESYEFWMHGRATRKASMERSSLRSHSVTGTHHGHPQVKVNKIQ